MPRKKRIKTKYTGVYYVFGNSKEKQKTEKIYYIRYRKKGRLIEEKVGQQNQGGMTPFKASQIRNQKIKQKEPKNISKRKYDRIIKSNEYLNWKFNKILNSIADGIWIFDHNEKLIHVNKAAEKLNNVKAENIIGKSPQELMATGLYDRSVALDVFQNKRQMSMVEKTKKTNKVLLYTGTPVLDKDGNISLIVVNERDVTNLTALQERLEQSIMMTKKFKETLIERNLLDLDSQGIVIESNEMRQVINLALKIAQIGTSYIMIVGESGTGKGLLAKFIHQNGNRRNKPFLQINCSSIPENLLEAELFGYEKGAFTGARDHGKVGLLELAHEGTLFLDEIGDTPLPIQAKLLKFLDDHQLIRVGGTKSREIDSIVIAATNRNIEKLIEDGHFRRDFFYRLSAFNIKIPPLRERPEDLFALIKYFLEEYSKKYNTKKRISQDGFEALRTHPFLGNVRELRNILKRAVVLSLGDVLDEFIINDIVGNWKSRNQVVSESKQVQDKFEFADEKRNILKALDKSNWNKSQAASLLGISRRTIYRKIDKFKLTKLSG